jgi:hypothetical protein
MPWRYAPIGNSWRTLFGRLARSFHRRAIRSQLSDQFARPDWQSQLRTELLRIDARRIL